MLFSAFLLTCVSSNPRPLCLEFSHFSFSMRRYFNGKIVALEVTRSLQKSCHQYSSVVELCTRPLVSWASLMVQLVKNVCNVGDQGLIPELGRFPGEGKGYPLQYSGLEGCKESDVTERLLLSLFTWVSFTIDSFIYIIAIIISDWKSCLDNSIQ